MVRKLAAEYSHSQPREDTIEALWKALLLMIRLILHPVGAWGRDGAEELQKRITWWDQGRFQQLHDQSRSVTSRQNNLRRNRTGTADIELATGLIERGQLSKAAKLLTSNGLAPGSASTLAQLRDPEKRPPSLTAPLPSEALNYCPQGPLQLDKNKLLTKLRSAKRGSAPGPSGCRIEHLKPLVEDDLVWEMSVA